LLHLHLAHRISRVLHDISFAFPEDIVVKHFAEKVSTYVHDESQAGVTTLAQVWLAVFTLFVALSWRDLRICY
jgi:hypothetical protein